MSTYIKVKSACGRKSASVDIYDLDLNTDGIRCCGECESIIESRNAWYKFFNYDPAK
jgi:hypothetical protein